MTAHRIALATFGSFGDLHPYMAIARELQRAGHIPVIATIEPYREKVEAAGFEFRLLRSALLDRPDRELIRKVLHRWTGAEFILRKLIMPALPTAYSDALSALEGVSLVVLHPLVFGARLAVETLKIPWVYTQLAPMAFLSAWDPPVLGIPPFVRSLHRLNPAMVGMIARGAKRSVRSWTAPYEKLRSELGLPPVRDPMFEGGYSPELALALFSGTLGRKMPDWPAQTVVTGFPFYDGEDAALSPELNRFLDAGEPPIVFTLGTSAVLDAQTFYQASAEAARMLGRRAVLLVGSEPKNIPAKLPETILPVAYAPFSLLFARSAAIVHQGGVGTTGQAMRAGRPMLVMPYAVDQPDNADRVRRLGIARVLTRKAYSARSAAQELDALMRERSYRQAAQEVAHTISLENGAKTACDLLLGRLA